MYRLFGRAFSADVESRASWSDYSWKHAFRTRQPVSYTHLTYRYNSQGKVCEIIDQEGNSETFRYDREGRRIFHEDRIGNQVRTTYNVDGRPVLERACDHMGENEVSRSWEYDGIGKMCIRDSRN